MISVLDLPLQKYNESCSLIADFQNVIRLLDFRVKVVLIASLRNHERFLIERFLIYLETSFLLLIIIEKHISLLQFV